MKTLKDNGPEVKHTWNFKSAESTIKIKTYKFVVSDILGCCAV